MEAPETDKYFAELMQDKIFREAIDSLLGFYERDAWRTFKSSKSTDDLLHAQGAGNMVDTLRNYFISRIATEGMIDLQRMEDE